MGNILNPTITTGKLMEQWQIWTDEDARLHFAMPKDTDDKYSRGVVGIIAGSKQYPGAGVLVCEAAVRTGVGMVRYLAPQSVQDLVLTHRPEVVIQDGQVQAWVIGSGLDTHRIRWRREQQIRQKMDQGLPVVLDAGGISFLSMKKGPVLITPHYRELASLLNSSGVKVSDAEIKNEPKKWARFAADSFRVTVLLKGNISYVVSKDREIELPAASSWLASAGTGDVLAGVLGALVATHAEEIVEQPEFLAGLAATACLIHARAAEQASNGGPISALGVAHAIPMVVSDLLHKRM